MRASRPRLSLSTSPGSRILAGEAAALVVVLLAGWTVAVHAVSVSVSEFAVSSEPGERIEGTFSVLNDDAGDVDVTVTLVDWAIDASGVTRMHPPATLDRSCAGWLDVEPVSLSIPSGMESTVRWALRSPDSVQGTYWAGMLLRVTTRRGDEEGAALQVVRQFLVRILHTVAPATYEGRVSEVGPLGLSPLTVEARFENVGTGILDAVEGWIVVENETGERMARLPIPSFGVLPGDGATREAQWTYAVQQPGLYLIRAVFDYGAEALVAGQVVLRVLPLNLAAIEAGATTPKDLDGDGLYEDVDGNGVVDKGDAELLRRALGTAVVQRNARAFDFDNDGRVTEADVVRLAERVLRGTARLEERDAS